MATTTTIITTLLAGPLCEEAAQVGCYHDSCQAIDLDGMIRLAEGPLCQSADYQGTCQHGSCQLVQPDQGQCATHGWQLITDAGTIKGYAGGRIYWAGLACGHWAVDETDDVRAAR